MKRFALALAAAVAIAGCSSTGNQPPAPVKAAVPGYQYLIGPGDSVQIQVWRNPELSATVPVRPDGKLTSPLIDVGTGRVVGVISLGVSKGTRESALQYPSGISYAVPVGYVAPLVKAR